MLLLLFLFQWLPRYPTISGSTSDFPTIVSCAAVAFALTLGSFLSFAIGFPETARVHRIVCAVSFRTQQWLDGCHTNFNSQHDFCPQCSVVDMSASIHLGVVFKVFGKQCFQRLQPDVLVQRQLCSSVVASFAIPADPLHERFKIASQVLDSALSRTQNVTKQSAGIAQPFQGRSGRSTTEEKGGCSSARTNCNQRGARLWVHHYGVP